MLHINIFAQNLVDKKFMPSVIPLKMNSFNNKVNKCLTLLFVLESKKIEGVFFKHMNMLTIEDSEHAFKEPVLDFIRIITKVGDGYNYWDNTVVCMVGKTSQVKSFMLIDLKDNHSYLKNVDILNIWITLSTQCALIMNFN